MVPREFRSERPPGASEDTERRGHHGPTPAQDGGGTTAAPPPESYRACSTVKLISKSCNPASHGT